MSRPKLHREVSSWVAAAAVAVAVHAAWWIVLAPDPQPAAAAAPQAPGPRLRYLFGDGGDGPPVPWLRSPLLFALPTEVGFSGGRVPVPAAGRALLQGDASSPLLLDRTVPAPAPAEPLPPIGDLVGREPWRAVYRLDAPAVFSPATLSTGFVLRTTWLEGEPNAVRGMPTAEDLAPWLDGKPWEASVVLQVDADGVTQAVFVEKGTPSRERNSALARLIQRVRLDSGGAAARFRVLLSYEPDVVRATAGAGP